jgi:hypothetical protein
MDDETATDAMLLQLERFAESKGMTPAWLGVMQGYESLRLPDGVLVLTPDERTTLYGKALGLWPEMTEEDVALF